MMFRPVRVGRDHRACCDAAGFKRCEGNSAISAELTPGCIFKVERERCNSFKGKQLDKGAGEEEQEQEVHKSSNVRM